MLYLIEVVPGRGLATVLEEERVNEEEDEEEVDTFASLLFTACTLSIELSVVIKEKLSIGFLI